MNKYRMLGEGKTGHPASGSPVPDIPFAEWRKETPAREPTLTADLLIPAGQALVSGLAVGVLALAFCLQGGYRSSWALFSGTLAFGTTWFLLLIGNRSLLQEVEMVIGIDLNGDGGVEESKPVRVEVTEKTGSGGPKISYVSLPDGVSYEDMQRIAVSVLGPSGSFSRPFLSDDRKLLTQSQYNELRRKWLQAGLLRALPGNRTEVTAAGRAVLRRFKEAK